MHLLRLSYALAKADFKLRNEGSYFGILWYLLTPLASFIILFLVFSQSIGTTIPSYHVYLLLGIILFNVFRHSTVESAQAVYVNRHLIRSVPFDYRALVLAVVLRILFSHLFEIGIFFTFAAFFNIHLIGIIVYPLVVVLLLLLSYGIGLGLAALYAYAPDIEHIWGAFVQALFFATPVLYALNQAPLLAALNVANPLYYILHISRTALIEGVVDGVGLLILLFFTLAALGIGNLIFLPISKTFTERY